MSGGPDANREGERGDLETEARSHQQVEVLTTTNE